MCISLWQPWATACFALYEGQVLKSIETRHWPARHRGRLAIHAAKKWDGDLRETAERYQQLGQLPADIPLGAIIGIVDLVSCSRVETFRDGLSRREDEWGNYGNGRYGWHFANARALPAPIPFRGAQGFFSVPDTIFPPDFLDRSEVLL